MLDFQPGYDRRVSRSDNPITALTRLLEATRQNAALEAVAIGDDLGLLVAGAGAAELCDELAAVAPLGTVARRVSVDGFEMFISGRGGDLGAGLSRVAEGCTRILAKKPPFAR